MVESKFDFNNMGKQMPYRTPDHFFEKMQERVIERARSEKRKKQFRMKLIISATLAAAAVLLGVLFFPVQQLGIEKFPANVFIVSTDSDYSYSDAMDQYIVGMSDEELTEWVELSENDIFIN